MSFSVFIGVSVVLCLVLLVVGQKASTHKGTTTDYFLSGKSIQFFGLSLTFLATQLGGGALIGATQAAYNYGWPAILYGAGLSLGLLLLGCGLGAKLRRLNVSTIPELFTKYYNAPELRVIAALISVTSLFFILLAIGVAGRKFFLSLFPESGLYAFLAMSVVMMSYTVFGGLKAIMKTDIIQALFIAGVLMLSLVFVDFKPLTEPGILSKGAFISSVPLSEWLLMPMLFTIIGQDMGQRCLAANTPATVSKATIAAGILLFILSTIPIGLGLMAKISSIHFTTDSSVLMQYLMTSTPPAFSALFAVAILMAILSTADSLICAISSNLSCDIFPAVNTNLSLKQSQLVTLCCGTAATFISLLFDDVIETMVLAYKFSIYTLFLPLVVTILSKRHSKSLVYGLLLAGLIAFLLKHVR